MMCGQRKSTSCATVKRTVLLTVMHRIDNQTAAFIPHVLSVCAKLNIRTENLRAINGFLSHDMSCTCKLATTYPLTAHSITQLKALQELGHLASLPVTTTSKQRNCTASILALSKSQSFATVCMFILLATFHQVILNQLILAEAQYRPFIQYSPAYQTTMFTCIH